MNKGMDIKLSKSNIRKQVGGSLVSTVLSLGARALPTIAKTIGLAGLWGGVETGCKKLLGRGQTGGFFIPSENLSSLYETLDIKTDKRFTKWKRYAYNANTKSIRWIFGNSLSLDRDSFGS